MKIRILGGDGGIAPGMRTTTFLVNDRILIDAGSAASVLSLEEQAKIDYIFISHPHIDHIKDLPFLADNLFGVRSSPIMIVSTPKVLGHVQRHLFNNIVWPDFSKIPNSRNPTICYKPVQRMKIDDLWVRMYSVHHPGDAVGFILQDGTGSITLTGDTGPTKLIWQKTNEAKGLKAVFTEISFPNHQEKVARLSGHLTPKMFQEEIKKMSSRWSKVPIYVYHLKPRYRTELLAEIKALSLDSRVVVLESDDEFIFK